MARRIKRPNPYSNRRPIFLQTGLGEDGIGTWDVVQDFPTVGETTVTHSISGEYFTLDISGSSGGGGPYTVDTTTSPGDAIVTDTASGQSFTIPVGGTINNTLTSTATDESLSAAQGKVLKDEQDNQTTVLGTTAGDTDLGTFSGTTITDAVSVKTALQELETALETFSITGQFIGSSATYATLPTTDAAGDAASVGDWAILTVDDGVNLSGVYSFNGTIYVFVMEIADSFSLDASGFDGNLTTTDDTLQEVAQKFDDYIAGNDRVFASSADVTVATAGEPTVAEIKTYNDGLGTPNADTVMYYTGTITSTDTPTYVFHIDKSGNVTEIQSPSSSGIDDVLAAGQALTANRIVTMSGNNITFDGAGNVSIIDDGMLQAQLINRQVVSSSAATNNAVDLTATQNKEIIISSGSTGTVTWSAPTSTQTGQIFILQANNTDVIDRTVAFDSTYVDSSQSSLADVIIPAGEKRKWVFVSGTTGESMTLIGDASFASTASNIVSVSKDFNDIWTTTLSDGSTALDFVNTGTGLNVVQSTVTSSFTVADVFAVFTTPTNFRVIDDAFGFEDYTSPTDDAVVMPEGRYEFTQNGSTFVTARRIGVDDDNTVTRHGTLTSVMSGSLPYSSLTVKEWLEDASNNQALIFFRDSFTVAELAAQFTNAVDFRRILKDGSAIVYTSPTDDAIVFDVGLHNLQYTSTDILYIRDFSTAGLKPKGTYTSDSDLGEGIYNLDASTAAFDWTLPAATGSQERRFFNMEDATNAVTVKVQVGEELNAATDGVFNIDILGYQYQAMDIATGKWVITKITQTDSAASATLLDSSLAIDAQVLPAATGSGDILFFANKDIVTNVASLAPQAGESLNGTTDGIFYFSNYSDGTQFIATDVNAGEWVIAVEGASTETDYSFHAQGVLDDYDPTTDNTLDFTTLIAAGSFTQSERNTSGWRTTATDFSPPKDGIYRFNLTLFHPDSAISGTNNQVGLGTFRPFVNLNGVDILLGVDATGGAPEAVGVTTTLNVVTTDVIKFGWLGSADTNEDFFVSVGIEPQTISETILAGMVEPTSLSHVTYSLSADATGIVCPFDVGQGDTSTIVNTTGTISLPVGKYRIVAHATRHAANLDYELYDATNSVSLAQSTVLSNATSSNGDTTPYYLTITSPTDIQIREGDGGTAVVWNGKQSGIDAGWDDVQPTFGCYIDIQQLPTSTVVNPDTLTPVAIGENKYTLTADGNTAFTGAAAEVVTVTTFTDTIGSGNISTFDGTNLVITAGANDIEVEALYHTAGTGGLTETIYFRDAADAIGLKFGDGAVTNGVSSLGVYGQASTNEAAKAVVRAGTTVTLNVVINNAANNQIVQEGSYIRVKEIVGQSTVIDTTDLLVDNQTALGYDDFGTTRIQHGVDTSGTTGDRTITLPQPMADANYTVNATVERATATGMAVIRSRTTTSFVVGAITGSGTDIADDIHWTVIGLK